MYMESQRVCFFPVWNFPIYAFPNFELGQTDCFMQNSETLPKQYVCILCTHIVHKMHNKQSVGLIAYLFHDNII